MTPRAVATWMAASLGIVILTNNPIYRTLVALVAINLLIARRRNGVTIRPLLLLLGAFAAFTVVYNPLLSHAGRHVIAEIPRAIPAVGGPVTVESLAYGASAAVGFVAAALITSTLFLVLEPTDIVDVLPQWLRGTSTALAAALNLLPGVATSFQRVRESEQLRGSPRHGPGALIGLVVPVTLSTIESSITLAEAMEARAYGSGRRTSHAQAAVGGRDALGAGAALGGLALMLALRLSGLELDWYPFPEVSVPGVVWPAVAACGLTAVALPAWSRRERA